MMFSNPTNVVQWRMFHRWPGVAAPIIPHALAPAGWAHTGGSVSGRG